MIKKAFLLLGAQRSGTSVTSHMLSKFDVNFSNPDNFLQATHNPIFFELKWINQYNDRILQSLGYQYTDPFLPIEADYHSASVLEIAEKIPTLIQQEWHDEPVIGIKDPRLSLTFPVWKEALLNQGYELNVILVFRHPGNFLRSNQKLFFNWQGWDEERHLHFWLRLTLAAIYFTRDYSVCWINYEDIMQQPLEVAQRMADFFTLDTRQVTAAAAVVDQNSLHHRESAKTSYSFNHYYDLLCSQRLSAMDYLNYRQSMLGAVIQ